ncbi:unnamed protein product [Brassica oleracea]|uniref:(rape) hypothetical protein n=1 Tax=Brassica napus TaxID=3708 RepID=A0A816UUF2_BRANA|nr:unnamed protein product [Brassica napus]
MSMHLKLNIFSLNYAVSDSFTKPGGLERSTDAFKETHNLTQALDDTLFGGCSKRGKHHSVLSMSLKNQQLPRRMKHLPNPRKYMPQRFLALWSSYWYHHS